MDKNTEIVEFFICPHCKNVSWEIIDYIPPDSSKEFACLAECDYCGEEVLVVDYANRCSKCEKKIECMATPLKLTLTIAMSLYDNLNTAEIKKLIKVLGNEKL